MRSFSISVLSTLVLLFLAGCESSAQIGDIKDLIKNPQKPTENEAATGLKQALNKGIDDAVDDLGAAGGFLQSPDYKIFLPPSAQKMEQRLRGMGMDEQVDRVIVQLNKGAEKAVSEASEVFTGAIREMTIQDAMDIVTGGQGSATRYLKTSTEAELTSRFRPIIENALNQVGATRNWEDLAKTYNKIPLVEPIETDLNAYVTQKALMAVFDEVRIVENDIRENPAKRTTEVLKKVFGYAEDQGN